jgi:hypothetical protein
MINIIKKVIMLFFVNFIFFYNSWLKYFLLIIIFSLPSQLAWSEEGEEKEPCYLEQEILKQLPEFRKSETWSLEKEKNLINSLPYIIYDEILYFQHNPDNPSYIDTTKCQNRAEDYLRNGIPRWISVLMDSLLREAAKAYLAKYALIDRPPISDNEVPRYEELANKGNISAMFELRRYYEYPDDDYNPEKTQARYWLFKAVEAGDETAMLEVGYDRPYSVRTNLSGQGAKVALDAACEGIVQTGPSPGPACFLYNLLIGDSPEQTGHLVLDQDHLSGQSVIPQELALKKLNEQVVIELTSFADFHPDLIRKDYFDLEGVYLGSDAVGNQPGYFWNYHLVTPNTPPLLFDTSGWQELERVKVRRWPYLEAFQFWEKEYPQEKRLKGLDEYRPTSEGASRIDEPGLSEAECSDYSQKVWKMRYQIENFYERMNKLIPLDLYINSRIDKRRYEILSNTERNVLSNFNSIIPTYNNLSLCEYISHRTIGFLVPNQEEVYRAYEKIDERPTYVIEFGSELESARMLQVCRYLDKFPDNRTLCYAAQVRFKTKTGFKYHYVINYIIPVKHSNGIQKKIEDNFFLDGKVILFGIKLVTSPTNDDKYIFLGNEISGEDFSRIDVFDEEFIYQGSSNILLSKIMVPNAKPLSTNLFKKVQNFGIKDFKDFRLNLLYDLLLFLYPECSDLIIEQHHFSNIKKD